MNPRPFLLAGLLALTGCAGGGLTGDVFRPAVYEVRPGDTLYSIAWRYGLDHRDLAQWNDLESPHRIRVGQRLRLSPGGERAQSDRPSGPPPEPRATTQDDSAAETQAAPGARDPAADAETAGAGPGKWRWPTDGELVGQFGGDGVSGRGIEVAGEPGAPVLATADGEVVYSGKGLQAYGQLVIIRHGGGFLSAYAHNDRLLVNEGQRVVAGQQIADMGKTNNGDVLLHFEIRRQGTPVDPLDFLPARD